VLSFSRRQVFISFPHKVHPSSIQQLHIIFLTQPKKIQEAALHHQLLIWALAFHEERHTKFHNLQTAKTQENSKDINKQNVAPLNFMITNRPFSWCFLPIHPSTQ